jgi:hypothetical protein
VIRTAAGAEVAASAAKIVDVRIAMKRMLTLPNLLLADFE